MGSFACLWYAALLENSGAHLQSLVITIGEILAILSGLTLAVPLALRASGESASTAMAAAASLDAAGVAEWRWRPGEGSPWLLPVDWAWVDAMSLFTTGCLISACASACLGSIAAFMDNCGDLRFYTTVVGYMDNTLMFWIMGIEISNVLTALRTFQAGGLLPPLLGAAQLLAARTLAMHWMTRYLSQSRPLELIHLPVGVKLLMGLTIPLPHVCRTLWRAHALHLPAARVRAAALCGRAGITSSPSHDGRAAPSYPSTTRREGESIQHGV